MRLLDPRTAYTLALYALPVVVAGLGWGAGAALLTIAVFAAAGMARAPGRAPRSGRSGRGYVIRTHAPGPL